jgi:hypothetical protein
MKKLFLLTAIAVFISYSAAFSGVSLNPDSSDNTSQKYILNVSIDKKSAQKDIYIIGSGIDLKRIIYIFHGFKPADDHYQQNPSYFIKNWHLDQLSKKYKVLFVLPENGKSVYPVTKLSDPFSDLSLLNAMKTEIDKRYKAADLPLSIGFSAGGEGAIKFAILNNIQEIVSISGNYDLHNLPPSEVEFHEKGFGAAGYDIFEKENPITLLKNIPPKTIYLFCEEKNQVNVQQAQLFVDASVPGLKLIDLRSLGKGYKHDWIFLTSPGITKNLENIISGNVSDYKIIQK